MIDIQDLILAVLVVIVTTIGMRLLYGYWPWQKQPSSKETMQDHVMKVFREQPPFQPSEADMTIGPPRSEIEPHDDKKES